MASNDHSCFLRPNSDSADARRQALQAEQAKLETELGRLTEAVVEGGEDTTLVKPSRCGRRAGRSDGVRIYEYAGQATLRRP
jgi:hypothetical protein